MILTPCNCPGTERLLPGVKASHAAGRLPFPSPHFCLHQRSRIGTIAHCNSDLPVSIAPEQKMSNSGSTGRFPGGINYSNSNFPAHRKYSLWFLAIRRTGLSSAPSLKCPKILSTDSYTVACILEFLHDSVVFLQRSLHSQPTIVCATVLNQSTVATQPPASCSGKTHLLS